jgi:hypothetical protein
LDLLGVIMDAHEGDARLIAAELTAASEDLQQFDCRFMLVSGYAAGECEQLISAQHGDIYPHWIRRLTVDVA